jgi:hypothetical protein
MNDKFHSHILCFSEHHMSKDTLHFDNIENSVLAPSGICTFAQNDICFNYLDISKYCEEKILKICAIQIEMRHQ